MKEHDFGIAFYVLWLFLFCETVKVHNKHIILEWDTNALLLAWVNTRRVG